MSFGRAEPPHGRFPPFEGRCGRWKSATFIAGIGPAEYKSPPYDLLAMSSYDDNIAGRHRSARCRFGREVDPHGRFPRNKSATDIAGVGPADYRAPRGLPLNAKRDCRASSLSGAETAPSWTFPWDGRANKSGILKGVAARPGSPLAPASCDNADIGPSTYSTTEVSVYKRTNASAAALRRGECAENIREEQARTCGIPGGVPPPGSYDREDTWVEAGKERLRISHALPKSSKRCSDEAQFSQIFKVLRPPRGPEIKW